MKEEIEELAVGGLNGEFYQDIRKYLEKCGCKWDEERGPEGELLAVKLTFPPGTTCCKLPDPPAKYATEASQWERRQVSFKEGGLLYWSIKSGEDINHINVPYVYLV